MFLGGSKSVSDQINVRLGGFNPAFRLFLKAVQNVNCTAKTNRINGAVGVGVEVFYQLQDTCASEPFQWLCI